MRLVEISMWYRDNEIGPDSVWLNPEYIIEIREQSFDETPHRTILVQLGSACQAYSTLESIPDLLARINSGSQEALSAANAAGGNQ